MEGAHPDDMSDLSQAAEQASEAINRVSKMTRPAVERMASRAHSAVDSLAEATCQAVDTLGRRGEQLMNAEARMLYSTRSYIGANPITSLALALAAGLLLSRLMSSR